LHVASLPSPYGIGDLGPTMPGWLDQLNEAGQSWWQALPLGPTGYGNSPYQSLSSFAGNELLISPDRLIEDGLLGASDCKNQSFPSSAIDYSTVIAFKRRILETASAPGLAQTCDPLMSSSATPIAIGWKITHCSAR
jgi:4-alpha-glucanotransferase